MSFKQKHISLFLISVLLFSYFLWLKLLSSDTCLLRGRFLLSFLRQHCSIYSVRSSYSLCDSIALRLSEEAGNVGKYKKNNNTVVRCALILLLSISFANRFLVLIIVFSFRFTFVDLPHPFFAHSRAVFFSDQISFRCAFSLSFCWLT